MADQDQVYVKQSRDDLMNLCEVRGIETSRSQMKEQLICALAEQDGAEQALVLISEDEPQETTDEEPSWITNGCDVSSGQPYSQIKSLLSSASLARPTAMEPRKCFTCNKSGHLIGRCPELRRPSPPASAKTASPSVLSVGGIAGGRADNLQSVTVDNSVTVGLRGEGSKDVLVPPGMRSCEDVIPVKAKADSRGGEVIPAVPRACVSLNQESGREVGISDPTNIGGRVGSLKPVTTDENVFVGLQETGSGNILALSGSGSCADVIPIEAMVITAVGGVSPLIPMACFALPRESEGKLKEVGIINPTNEFLGTDMGKLVAQNELISIPLMPLSPSEDLDLPSVLFGDSMHVGISGDAHGVHYCVPEIGPSGSLELKTGTEGNDMMDSGIDNVLCNVLCNDVCAADVPSATVETYSAHQSSSDWPLLTVTEESSAERENKAGLGPSKPGSDLKFSPLAIPLVSVADSSEFPEAARIDSGLQELRDLTDRPPVEHDQARGCVNPGCGSTAGSAVYQCVPDTSCGKETCGTVEPGKDKYRGMITAHNDKFACTLSECRLWPADGRDPQGDLLASSDLYPLGSVSKSCWSFFQSARVQAEGSMGLRSSWGTAPQPRERLV